MNEEKELLEMEKKWQEKFERFTAPEPSREQTFALLDSIRTASVEEQVYEMPAEIEQLQTSRTTFQKIRDLLRSQWTFYGMTSWLLTAVFMIVLTTTIHANYEPQTGFVVWIKWMSFSLIALIAYLFRPRNEGNAILERLSYYPLIQQLFARFVIVMTMQGVIVFPLSFFFVDSMEMFTYLVATYVPLFFFGVVGFISTIWFGGKIGAIATALLWALFVFVDQQVGEISIFRLVEQDTISFRLCMIIIISFLLLASVLLKDRRSV